MATAPLIEIDTPNADAVDGRQLRAVAFQAVRLEYVAGVLRRRRLEPSRLRALVVGSGRGDLARGLAGLGLHVTAVDPSPVATGLAAAASERAGLPIAHETATSESLPFPDGAFDLAYYADTFEITGRLDQVLAEAARVVRGDGLVFYDTVNRTLPARLTYLVAFQSLPMTRIMPRGRYAAARLRPPAELAALMVAYGLRNEDVCGFKPKDPRNLVKAVLARRRGRIGDHEVAPLVDFVLDPAGTPLVTYLGHASRTGET
ncbi:class I SAM-dependent methyltransferase [Actinopolymorpha pittospori]|uniref:2-polyprenyl-6-hydroxyphenyl methylase/3-demethylubiquinone-9 3-methyltransferase n=1 Tax=Actinopolymorpha pittospori TaxID=648752 RepID=A0A927R7X0_9ACTN|nr:methyltransferase domain-containing protein [Actinopolymorpha pittospori]MBE1606032.1 2-polyprenyl-6-hydroxyphenyl methylase/3-demethylubiquinone-9 3-methyltransferase [Actinopolymorpha pittospori]